MKTKLVLAAAALALGACATTTTPPNDAFAASHVVAGVSTRAQVDQLLGKPYHTVALKDRKSESTYAYKDIWGYAMALFVMYDDKGIVVARYAERLER